MRKAAIYTAVALGCAALGFENSADASLVTGQISTSGYAAPVGSGSFGSATGIDFVDGPTGATGSAPGVLSSYGGGTGTFAALGSDNSGNVGTIKDLPDFLTPVLTLINLKGGPAVSFDADTFIATHNVAADSLTLEAIGEIHFSGFNDTPGQLVLSVSGDGTNSFSATLSAVPEPASLSLLAMGSLGLLNRRRRRV